MKAINRIIDMLISSGRNGDISFDSDGLLESLAKSKHQPRHFWELSYQRGVRFVLILAAAIMMITVIVYYGIRYINDVILYENQLIINEQGAFNPKKSLNCEYALYLFNTADLWANSGIQVNKKDKIRITFSGAFNSTVEGTILAAKENTQQKYPWFYYDKQKKDSTEYSTNNWDPYCLSRNQKDYYFGTIMYLIAPESGNLQSDPLGGDSLTFSKWDYTDNPDFHPAGKTGTLFFAVNDLYFQNDEEMCSYYEDPKHTDFHDRPFTIKDIKARLGRSKPDYEDNLGQLLVSVEIQRHVPFTYLHPTMAYRDFEYKVNHDLDSDKNIVWKAYRCIIHFLKFFFWVTSLLAIYMVSLLLIIYILFFIGHWIKIGFNLLAKHLCPKSHKAKADLFYDYKNNTI